MANPRRAEIEAIRKSRGMKRSELAERTGLSYQHVYGIERGFNRASEEVLHRIANTLGVAVEQVMDQGDPKAVA